MFAPTTSWRFIQTYRNGSIKGISALQSPTDRLLHEVNKPQSARTRPISRDEWVPARLCASRYSLFAHLLSISIRCGLLAEEKGEAGVVRTTPRRNSDIRI